MSTDDRTPDRDDRGRDGDDRAETVGDPAGRRGEVGTLLAAVVPRPSAPPDPAELRARSRHRVRRDRVAGGTAVAVTSLLLVVAWPGGVSPGPTIDEVAGGGTDPASERTDDVPADLPDLPNGWTQVEVGDAVLGVPGTVEVVDLAPSDPVPCPNTADVDTVYLAADGYPTGGGGCDAPLSHAWTVVVAPLSSAPLPIRSADDGDEGLTDWETVEQLEVPAQVQRFASDPTVGRDYRFPELDLWLAFAGAPTHDTAVLATVRDADGVAASPTPRRHDDLHPRRAPLLPRPGTRPGDGSPSSERDLDGSDPDGFDLHLDDGR